MNHNSTPNTQRENLYSLFRVKSNSHLELRDCVVKSSTTPNFSPFEAIKTQREIQDICFILSGNSAAKNNALISLKSCRITNFFSILESHGFSNLNIEKCHFSEIKSFGINASNLISGKLWGNTFERIGKSCINLRFSREDTENNSKRKIIFRENEFKNCYSYGLSIYSENLSIHQFISLSISKNGFTNLRKDVLCLKNLSFSCIEIKSNEICNSKQNGITLENCIDTVSGSQTELSLNKIFNCGGYGLFILDSPIKSFNNEIFQNEKGGISLSGNDSLKDEDLKHFSENPIRIIFNECNIYDNAGFGIGITGLMKGPVLMIKCYIYENLDGIFVRENEEMPVGIKGRDKSDKKPKSPVGIGQISLEKSSVFQNKRSGVFLDCLVSEAFISETLIKDNHNQAVILSHQKDKNLIHFRDKNNGKLRDFVFGFIGGAWGELFEEKAESCKGNKCVIF